MTRQECVKLIAAMMAVYTDRYPDPEEALRRMLPGWYMVLEDYEYAEASAGLRWYARSDKKGFPPVPGQVVDGIIQARRVGENSQLMDEAAAWKICYRAMCDSAYHAEEQFEKLPPIIQRAVGSPAILQQMALEENVGVTRGQFARAFQQAVARQGKEETMPRELREMLQKEAERVGAETKERIRAHMDAVAGAWIEDKEGSIWREMRQADEAASLPDAQHIRRQE